MTNSLNLSSIFDDMYAVRKRTVNDSGESLTSEFRSRFWLFSTDMVHPYDHYSRAGHKISNFWATLRDKLRYRLGRARLADRSHPTVITEVEAFLSECSDEHYLDFIEMFFQSEDLPKYFSDSDLRDAVRNVNMFFTLDNLPYQLTEFSISKSRTLVPRFKILLLDLFRRLNQVEASEIKSSHTQPSALPIRIPTIEAYPQIIRRDNEILQKTAIQPTLNLLENPVFKAANLEFLAALKDYREGKYADCVVKCGSSFESVMKIICERKSWPVDREAGKLLNTVLRKTDLPPFLKQPLIQIATIRNELGSAHGAGAQPRRVSQHLAQYSINLTASATLFIVGEVKP